jgi:hypothetical protein
MNPTGPCMLWNNGDGYLFHCQFEKKERVKMRVYGLLFIEKNRKMRLPEDEATEGR